MKNGTLSAWNKTSSRFEIAKLTHPLDHQVILSGNRLPGQQLGQKACKEKLNTNDYRS